MGLPFSPGRERGFGSHLLERNLALIWTPRHAGVFLKRRSGHDHEAMRRTRTSASRSGAIYRRRNSVSLSVVALPYSLKDLRDGLMPPIARTPAFARLTPLGPRTAL
jgi:hypothetical protein